MVTLLLIGIQEPANIILNIDKTIFGKLVYMKLFQSSLTVKHETVNFGDEGSNPSAGAKRGWYRGCALVFQTRDMSSILIPRSKDYEYI